MSSFLVLNAVFSLLSLSFVIPVSAVLQNVTIDDTNGDPFTGQQFVYLPEDKWAAGQDCPTCAAQPDPSRVMDQSWHDSSHWANDSNTIPSASVIFQGTALYVYCILNNFWGNSDMTFYIDDMYMGHYYCANGGCPGLEYSVLVYSNNSLEAGRNHTFTLANGENGGPQSLVLLDYIQYTTELEIGDPSPSLSQSAISSSFLSNPQTALSSAIASNTALASDSTTSHGMSSKSRTVLVVIAAVVGGTTLLIVVTFCLWRRGKRRTLPRDGPMPFGARKTSRRFTIGNAFRRRTLYQPVPYDLRNPTAQRPVVIEPETHMVEPVGGGPRWARTYARTLAQRGAQGSSGPSGHNVLVSSSSMLAQPVRRLSLGSFGTGSLIDLLPNGAEEMRNSNDPRLTCFDSRPSIYTSSLHLDADGSQVLLTSNSNSIGPIVPSRATVVMRDDMAHRGLRSQERLEAPSSLPPAYYARR